jgi:hypothetical protein
LALAYSINSATAFGRERRIGHHNERALHDAGHARDIADEIKWQVLIERRIDRILWPRQEQRATVRPGLDHGLDSEIAAAARAVVDDDRLTQRLLQRLPDQPRSNIADAAGRKTHHDVDRPRSKRIRCCRTRNERPCRGAGRKRQNLAAKEIHADRAYR